MIQRGAKCKSAQKRKNVRQRGSLILFRQAGSSEKILLEAVQAALEQVDLNLLCVLYVLRPCPYPRSRWRWL